MEGIIRHAKDSLLGRNEREEEEAQAQYGSGMSGHGGRPGDIRPAHYGEDTERDTRAYPRESAHGGYDYEAEGGMGGHGGRPGLARDASSENLPHLRGERESYYDGSSDYDYREAHAIAKQHAGGGEHNSSLFASALGLLSGREARLRHDDIDEGEYVQSHKVAYGHEEGEKTGQSLAQAAALQALKRFTGGEAAEEKKGGQNAFVGMAMAEAVKLFDVQSAKGNVVSIMMSPETSGDADIGQAPSESKQDVVSQAAQIAVKLFLKSKVDAAGGGSSGLLGLASKFMM
jgi:hypothetical protein